MHPVLFRIGSFDVAWYGVLIAVGVLLGVIVALHRAKQVGVSADLIFDLVFYGVLIGFVGSRVFFILANFRWFLDDPVSLIFSRQGYVFFGGLIATLVFAIWYVRRHKMDAWQVGDIIAPSIPLAHAFGRVGCFMSGCCYGMRCAVARFPEALCVQMPKVTDPQTGEIIFSYAYFDHLDHGWITPAADHSLPIVPVQLVESAGNLLLFVGLWLLWRHRSFRGQIFAAYLAGYGLLRFLDEFWRGDYSDPALWGHVQRGQIAQAISLLAIAGAIGIWLYRRRREQIEEAQAADVPREIPRQDAYLSEHRKGKKRRNRKR